MFHGVSHVSPREENEEEEINKHHHHHSKRPHQPPSSSSVSIFKHLPFMSFLRFVGAFPLRYVDDDPECLQFYPKSGFFLVAVMAFILLIYLAEVLVLRMNGLYGWTLSAEMKQQGLKTTDTVAMILLWIPNIIAMFGYYFTFMYLGPNLSTLSRKVCEGPDIGMKSGDIKAFLRWGRIRRVSGLIIGVVACILSGVIDGLIVYPILGSSSPWLYVVGFLKALLTGHIVISPTSALSTLLTTRALASVRLMSVQYTEKMQELADYDGDASNVHWRFQFIKTGFYITELVHLTEKCLGPIIFISFSVSVATEILAGFFGIMIFTAFSDNEFNILEFHFGLFFALLGCWHFNILLSLASKCQKISNLAKKARRLTEIILYRDDMRFDESEMVRLGILMKRWSRPAALRPLDAFDVGRAMWLSLYGLLATYIIVLQQFRIGESASCNT